MPRFQPLQQTGLPSSPQLEVAQPLPRSFYARKATVVARDLLGKILIHQQGPLTTAGLIVETEAYQGPEDLAAHSSKGRRTPRNEVMYGPPGHAYLFLLYGMHWAFNVVTAQQDVPHAVLLRALQPLEGLPTMAARRHQPEHSRLLTNGPGKLCQAMGLRREHYGVDLCDGPLFIANAPKVPFITSPRINVDYAGAWAARPWRWSIPGNAWVSVKPKPAQS